MMLEDKETGKIKYVYDDKEIEELMSTGAWKKLSGIDLNRMAMKFKI